MNLAKLALEDGTVFTGRSFGSPGMTDGEVVFNTSMTGYQEILTDPSYKGQIITMTYPLIGNYGINEGDMESGVPHLSGFVIRELSRITSNYRCSISLGDYLKEHGIVGMADIDTRALVRRIRMRGAMKGILSTTELDDAKLTELARQSPGLVGRDLVREVVPTETVSWTEGLALDFTRVPSGYRDEKSRPHVVALDFGMKWNIARHLSETGCDVTVMPGTSTSCQILEKQPDGVFLSNGPGDPSALGYAVESISDLVQHSQKTEMPIFGICLGHQLLSQALGAETFKLKFGHRGANQPVVNHQTGEVEITTQNHGFAVDPDSLPAHIERSHTNLNDGTNEGIRHRDLPVFSVQYHPEASSGPHDSFYLFQEFRQLLTGATSAQ